MAVRYVEHEDGEDRRGTTRACDVVGERIVGRQVCCVASIGQLAAPAEEQGRTYLEPSDGGLDIT